MHLTRLFGEKIQRLNKLRTLQKIMFLGVLTALSAPILQAQQPFTISLEKKYADLLSPSTSILARSEHLILTQLSSLQLDNLSRKIHQDSKRCGGFVDLSSAYLQSIKSENGLTNELAALLQEEEKHLFSEVDEMSTQSTHLDFLAQEPNQFYVVGPLLEQVSENNYWATLKTLSGLNDRSAKGSGGTKATQLVSAQIKDVFKNSTLNYQINTIATPSYSSMPTVVVKIAGTDASLPGIVLGAHLDSINQSWGGSSKAPGADDDASGSAALLEVARVLANSNTQLKRTVYLAFYAAEERGLVGSAAMVANFKQNRIAVQSVLQLDMIGFRSSSDHDDIYLIGDNTNNDLNQFGEKLIKAYLPELTVTYTQCGYACSDHASWHRQGIAAFFPFEASFEHYNQALHTERDTMSILNLKHAIKFVKIALAFAVEQANN